MRDRRWKSTWRVCGRWACERATDMGVSDRLTPYNPTSSRFLNASTASRASTRSSRAATSSCSRTLASSCRHPRSPRPARPKRKRAVATSSRRRDEVAFLLDPIRTPHTTSLLFGAAPSTGFVCVRHAGLHRTCVARGCATRVLGLTNDTAASITSSPNGVHDRSFHRHQQ